MRATKRHGELDEFGACVFKGEPDGRGSEANVLSERGANSRGSFRESQSFLVCGRGTQMRMNKTRRGDNKQEGERDKAPCNPKDDFFAGHGRRASSGGK